MGPRLRVPAIFWGRVRAGAHLGHPSPRLPAGLGPVLDDGEWRVRLLDAAAAFRRQARSRPDDECVSSLDLD